MLDEASCDQMARTLPRCIELLRQCYHLGTPIACSTANKYCEETQTSAYYKTVRARDDPPAVSNDAEPPFRGGRRTTFTSEPCRARLRPMRLTSRDSFGDYKEDAWIEHYLNLDEIRKELGVDPGVGRYYSCSDGVGDNFSATGDQ